MGGVATAPAMVLVYRSSLRRGTQYFALSLRLCWTKTLKNFSQPKAAWDEWWLMGGRVDSRGDERKNESIEGWGEAGWEE